MKYIELFEEPMPELERSEVYYKSDQTMEKEKEPLYFLSLGALSRFAELSALIFPKKARMFVEHMLPSFCSIATRSEEMLYEKLPDSFDLIFRVLGRSMNDQEIKVRRRENSNDEKFNRNFVFRHSLPHISKIFHMNLLWFDDHRLLVSFVS